MSFWRGETLLSRGDQVVQDFDPDKIDCNGYRLSMGAQYYRTADQEDRSGEFQKRVNLKERESFVIPPGQFAFLLNKETITVPCDAMAFISMRTHLKFQGLVNISGFHVDPGYVGKLVFSVYNASPSAIELREGDPIFKIWFCNLDERSSPEYTWADKSYSEITSDMVRGMNREILSLQSLATKLRDQQVEIDKKFAEQKPTIDNLAFIWRAITIGFLLAVVAFVLPLAYGTGRILWDYVQKPPAALEAPANKSQ